MNIIKEFFGIKEIKYHFEWADVTSILTVINVALILSGFWWAPIIGLINCVLGLILNAKYTAHVNMYIMQVALIVLNWYFLTM